MVTKATRMRGGVYASNAQIDAVAAASFSSTSAAIGSSLPDEDADVNAYPLLAVAQSNLEGNQWGGVVSLIDASSYEQLCAFQLASGVSSLAWCGVDGDVLALACDNGDVQLVRASQIDGDFAFLPQSGGGRAIDGDDAEEEPSFAAGWGHDDVVTSVSASLFDTTRIATGSWDLTVKLWDISCMDKTIATLEGHTDLIWSVAMNHKSAHLLASASQDCTVQIWDDRQPTDAVQAISTEFPALVVDWRPHNETIFSVGLEDGSVLTFDTRSPTTPLFQATPHDGPVHALKYSRFHEDLLASGGDDASVFVRDGSSQAPSRIDADHSDYVRALEWFQVPAAASSSSSTVLATASWDKAMRTWSVEDQQHQQQQVDLRPEPRVALRLLWGHALPRIHHETLAHKLSELRVVRLDRTRQAARAWRASTASRVHEQLYLEREQFRSRWIRDTSTTTILCYCGAVGAGALGEEVLAPSRVHEQIVGRLAEQLHDARELVGLILPGKNRVPRVQLHEDAAETPHVDHRAVGEPEDHLGAAIEAALDVREHRGRLEAAAAKVDQADLFDAHIRVRRGRILRTEQQESLGC